MAKEKIGQKSKPRVQRYLYMIPMDDNKLQIREGTRIIIVEGKSVSLVTSLLPLLNGEKTVEEIISCRKDIDEALILDILNTLHERGFIEDISVLPSFSGSSEELQYYSEQLVFFSHYNDKFACQEKLRNSRVLVLGINRIGFPVLSALASSGIGTLTGADPGMVEPNDIDSGLFHPGDMGKPRCDAVKKRLESRNPYISFRGIKKQIQSETDIADLAKGHNLIIVCSDRPDVSLFQWVNEVCLRERIPWTSARLQYNEGIVGPAIFPNETPCYTCFELRLKGNERFYSEYIAFEKYLKDNPGNTITFGSIPAFTSLIANYAALEAIKIITAIVPHNNTFGKICTIDFFTLETRLHKILKVPRCPSCGSFRSRVHREPFEVR